MRKILAIVFLGMSLSGCLGLMVADAASNLVVAPVVRHLTATDCEKRGDPEPSGPCETDRN